MFAGKKKDKFMFFLLNS